MMAKTHLTTPRLQLRPIDQADFPAFRDFCTSERAKFLKGPISSEDAFLQLSFITGHWVLRGFGRYVLDLDGRGIGHAGPVMMEDDGIPQMTWSIWSSEDEGQGYAREAVSCILTHLLDDLGCPTVLAIVHQDNARSRELAVQLNGRVDHTPPAAYAEPDCDTYRFEREAA